MSEGYSSREAGSFGAAAAEYERARPTYPAAAVDWIVPAGTRSVADIGAGTGKFTRSLLGRGLEVTAVEPSAGMREALVEALVGVRALAGSAERLPLPDAAVDLVTYAQAWHWVDVEPALAEAARVLRPGGSLACVWNLRDDDSGWMAELAGLIRDFGRDTVVEDGFALGPPFGPTESFELAWTRPMTGAGLVELLASRSYVIVAPEPERQRLFAAVRDLAATHPELAGRESFEMPYVTRCFRAALGG